MPREAPSNCLAQKSLADARRTEPCVRTQLTHDINACEAFLVLHQASSCLISLMHVQSSSIPISTLARIDFGDIAFLIGQSFPLYIADKSLESSQVAVVWASNARMVANWWQPQVWPETEMCQDVP